MQAKDAPLLTDEAIALSAKTVGCENDQEFFTGAKIVRSFYEEELRQTNHLKSIAVKRIGENGQRINRLMMRVNEIASTSTCDSIPLAEVRSLIAGWQAREQNQLSVTPEAFDAACRAFAAIDGSCNAEAMQAALEALQPKPEIQP